MPPTTGGNTSGNNTRDRTSRCPGNCSRASTMAIGTPRTRQTSMLVNDVCRLSVSAASDDGLAIRTPKRAQSIRSIIATSGSATNNPPMTAGR